MSAFLEIGVFHDKISPSSKWLLKFLNKNSSFEDKKFIYNAISSLESDYSKEKNKSKKTDHDLLFYEVFVKFTSDINLNIPLAAKYLDEFYLKNKNMIVNYLFTISENNSKDKIIDLILNKYKNENISIQQEFNLNSLLPKNKKDWDEKFRFFIHRGYKDKIIRLSGLGFNIDDNNYLFNEETLFLNLIKIKNDPQHTNFNHYSSLLEHIKNFDGVKEEDIELFSKEKQYKTLKTNFEYYSLSSDVKNRNNIKANKIKV